MFQSKAQTLINLQKYENQKKFIIPKLLVFKVKEFKKDKKNILNYIQQNFPKSLLAIRSSSLSEDTSEESNAGKYHSFLNIKSNNYIKINSCVRSIIDSYSGDTNIENNEIIFQKMVNDVTVSGVCFTKELNSKTPYYVINYDDNSGSTDTVTSGSGKYSNKSLYVFKDEVERLRSTRFKKLLKNISLLEKITKNKSLDIEFAIDKQKKIYILQLRPIVLKKENTLIKNNVLKKKLNKLYYKIRDKQKRAKNIFGKKAIFGQMPDWNPAEIIGSVPNNLDISLYEKLITNKVWLIARKKMGYYSFENSNLLENFCGHIYVDVRKSFNSFLPKTLDKKLCEKIINLWIKKLELNPNYHDKVEFNIAFTCFRFDLKKDIKIKYPKCFNETELKQIVKAHIKLFKNNLDKFSEGSLYQNIKKIKILDRIQSKKKYFDKNKIDKIFNDTINLGTLPFAIIARHAFISMNILYSLQNEGVINEKERIGFIESISTITSEFLEDLNKIKQKKFFNFFFKKYGHLRPGMYDINSKSYSSRKKIFTNSNFKQNRTIKIKQKFNFRKKKLNKINLMLKKNGFNKISAKDLINYIRLSIEFREKAKFIFSKNLNYILNSFLNFYKKKRLKVSQICFLDYSYKKKGKRKINEEIKKREKEKKINQGIVLPQIIYEPDAAYISPYQNDSANFVTNKKVIGQILFMNNKKLDFKLDNKIILIENADPGYDWIFGNNIKGLITKFGGANSHMRIRCSELNIPAAIGCGEKKFNELKKGKTIELDCGSGKIILHN